MANYKVSNSVIKRLPRYYRFLGELQNNNVSRISSGSFNTGFCRNISIYGEI